MDQTLGDQVLTLHMLIRYRQGPERVLASFGRALVWSLVWARPSPHMDSLKRARWPKPNQ